MNEGRALALWHVAGHAQGRVRAVVASVAAELLLDAGQLAEARLAAEMAVDADPSWQRGVAAQALVAQRDPDSAAAVLLERSLAVVLARGSTCQVLADSSERRGALRLALTWTQRQLAQRPGDPEVAKELLRRAAEAGGERPESPTGIGRGREMQNARGDAGKDSRFRKGGSQTLQKPSKPGKL